MDELPFEIPWSLNSYVSRFKTRPDKGIEQLETYLHRRGQDAVGYFVLAWMYFRKGDLEKALELALKAKCYAPGSPMMEHLHYYFLHPDRFQAEVPAGPPITIKTGEHLQDHPSADIDDLINRLSQRETSRIVPEEEPGNDAMQQDLEVDDRTEDDLPMAAKDKESMEGETEEKQRAGKNDREEERSISKQSPGTPPVIRVEDIASETLADIYEEQNKYKQAIHTLEKLKNLYPDKRRKYDERINRLVREKNRQSGSNTTPT